jgi:hypothetical protein
MPALTKGKGLEEGAWKQHTPASYTDFRAANLTSKANRFANADTTSSTYMYSACTRASLAQAKQLTYSLLISSVRVWKAVHPAFTIGAAKSLVQALTSGPRQTG